MNQQTLINHSAQATPAVGAAGAVIARKGVLAWEPIAAGAPGPGQILVRTIRSLVSPGTELSFWCGTHAQLDDPTNRWAKYPFHPGYCAVGTVEAVGADITGFIPGDIVACDGRHAPLLLLDAAQNLIAKVPAGIDTACAPFAKFHSIVGGIRSTLPPLIDGPVVVVGSGIIGILAAQWLRAAGIDVSVEDVSTERLSQAAACGLAVRSPTDPEQAPAAIIDATGVASLVPQLLARVARNGTVVLLGSPRTPVEIDIYRHIHAKSVSLIGAHGGRFPHKGKVSQQSFFEEGLAMMADGRSDVRPLITQVIRPQILAEAYAALAGRTPGWLGVELEWSHA